MSFNVLLITTSLAILMANLPVSLASDLESVEKTRPLPYGACFTRVKTYRDWLCETLTICQNKPENDPIHLCGSPNSQGPYHFAATEALAHHHHDDLVHHHSDALLHSLASTDHSLLHHDLQHDLHHDLHHDVHHHDVHHVHHDHVVVTAAPQPTGFWKKKLVWKPRWVKSWQEKKVYVGVWKRVWGPVQVTEWVPIPKPPPGWSPHH